MTEYDSGSSGDTSADASATPASSAPDESASGGGIDVSWLVQQLIDDLAEPAPRRPPSPSGPSEAERRRRATFERTLRDLFLAARPAGDTRGLPRRIVEHDRWFLPTQPDGSIVRLSAIDERARQAFTRPLAPRAPPRSDQARPAPRAGRVSPGVVTALAADPSRPARQCSGRELPRVLPADAEHVLFVLDAETSVGLGRDELDLLVQVAESLDLEEMLARPGPGQVAALRAARWYVPASNPKLRPEVYGGDPLVCVWTHPDRADPSDGPMAALDGLALCRRLVSRGDYDGIAVNLGSHVGAGDQQIEALVLGPSFARGIVRGVDPRPGAEPLPARTLAEVVLWLDLDGFPWTDREIVPAAEASSAVPSDGPTAAGATLIQVRASGPSRWRVVESRYAQSERPGPFMSPVFALARADQLPPGLPAPIPPGFATVYGGHLSPDTARVGPAAIDLGEGPTQILCAGKLASWLYRRHTWRRPGWLVSKLDRLRAARMAGWAHELLKLVPPDGDRLPRSSVRTAEGAGFLRDRSTFATRAWLEEQQRTHTRAARRWFSF